MLLRKRRKWLPHETTKLLALFNDGLDNQVIGERMNRSAHEVCRRIKMLTREGQIAERPHGLRKRKRD